MELSKMQKEVDHWIETYGIRYFDQLTNLGLLMEEVGELSRVLTRKYGEQSSKDTDLEVKLEEELADVLFVLTCLANQCDIDLESAFRKNLDKKTLRDNTRHLKNEKLNKGNRE